MPIKSHKTNKIDTKPKSGKSLAEKSPELAKEWHPTKNGDLTPYDVTLGSNKKVWWRCFKGHVWPAVINSRNQGNGCPYCSGRKISKDNSLAVTNPERVENFWDYEKNKVSPYDISRGQIITVYWTCSKDHLKYNWETTPSNFRGCNKCKELCKITQKTKEYKRILEKHEIEVLSNQIINQKEKHKFKCKNGHIFPNTFDNLKTNQFRCPKCYERVFESHCRYILEELLNIELPEKKISIENKTRYLDGYNDEKKIAFEAQGIQHRDYVPYFHSTKAAFSKQIKHDEDKKKYCKENNLTLIIIHDNFKKKHPKLKYDKALIKEIKNILNSMGIPYNNNKNIDLENYRRPTKTLEEMKKKAQEKNGKLISQTYYGARESHEWFCNICKNQFSHTWDIVKRDVGWCRICTNGILTYKQMKSEINKIKGITGKTIKLLTKENEYKNAGTPLKVICDLEHVTTNKSYTNWKIKPICTECNKNEKKKKLRLPIEKYHEAAKEKNHTFIGLKNKDEVLDTNRDCYWQCNTCKESSIHTYNCFLHKKKECQICKVVIEKGEKWGWKFIRIIERTSTKLSLWIIEWQCLDCGYLMKRRRNTLTSSQGCRFCVHYIKNAKELGWKYLSNIDKLDITFQQTTSRAKWECLECGTQKDATFKIIKDHPCGACKRKLIFNRKFSGMVEFINKNNRLPQRTKYRSENEKKLGHWKNNQRQAYKNDKLLQEEIKLLKEIGVLT